jgi:hypothetical protein
MSKSIFAKAFLISFVADASAGNHRLTLCARKFVKADMTDVGALRRTIPDASAIIDALKDAEEKRILLVQLADSADSLSGAIHRVQADPLHANLEVFGLQLASASKPICGKGASDICSDLNAAREETLQLRKVRSELDAASGSRALLTDAINHARDDSTAAVIEHDSIKTNLDKLTQLSPADTVLIEATKLKVDALKAHSDSISTGLAAVMTLAQKLDSDQSKQQEEANIAQSKLLSTLSSLTVHLSKTPGFQRLSTQIEVAQLAPSNSVYHDIEPSTSSLSESTVSARPANLALELTDFIIARAKREMVNSFVVNLYKAGNKDTLLAKGFPNTWGLMNSLPKLRDSNLNAVAVGRIPLTTWRASLSSDFENLTVNLLGHNPEQICARETSEAPSRSSEAKLGANGKPLQIVARVSPSSRKRCLAKVAMLRPASVMAARLIAGDPIFEILEDADSYTSFDNPNPQGQAAWVGLGLSVLSSLAQAYVEQGTVPSVDATKFPYLLSARIFTHVSQDQRDALLRLLLVNAIRTPLQIPKGLSQVRFNNAILAASRALDRAARLDSASEAKAGARIVRAAFEAMGTAADMASVFASSDTDSIADQWRGVADAIEPMAAGNFGLALTRTAMLLQNLRGVEVPGQLVTFAALASALAEARNRNEVNEAFEAAASPVGGWQANRYGDGSVSISAFPGIVGGWEAVAPRKGQPKRVGKTEKSIGVSLPVGINAQLRLHDTKPGSISRCRIQICGLGVFLPMLDLGALLDYRISGDDAVASEPNAKIKQVFAPGVYVNFAFTRTFPINVLAGAQFMPALRKVTVAETTEDHSVIRVGFGVGMDLQLFRF